MDSLVFFKLLVILVVVLSMIICGITIYNLTFNVSSNSDYYLGRFLIMLHAVLFFVILY